MSNLHGFRPAPRFCLEKRLSWRWWAARRVGRSHRWRHLVQPAV